VISVLLEGFAVNGAIATVEIAAHFQRNGDIGCLRSVGCRKHKRDDSKDGGEREMHLSRQAELSWRTTESGERETRGEFEAWTVVVIFRPRVGPVTMEINGRTSI
jgi:hypothetical protein